MSGIWSNVASSTAASASASCQAGRGWRSVGMGGHYAKFGRRRRLNAQDATAPVDYRCGMHRVRVIDSHTGGEPTRVVIDGGPDLGHGPLAERRERFRKEHDRFRSAVVNEPRGSD